MTDAQQIAQTVGIVVGAASCCEQVTEERINAVAVKLRELVAAAADDDSDADLANEQFSAALEEGKTAVESGRIDPEQA
jgi:DNA-binding GntR family transcriptional regulator